MMTQEKALKPLVLNTIVESSFFAENLLLVQWDITLNEKKHHYYLVNKIHN